MSSQLPLPKYETSGMFKQYSQPQSFFERELKPEVVADLKLAKPNLFIIQEAEKSKDTFEESGRRSIKFIPAVN